MEFKVLKTSEIISLSLILIGVLSQIILQVLLYVPYFFIPAVFIGTGFTLFGASKIIENPSLENKEQRSYEGLLFFHDRPMFISVLSLIVGIIFPLGEFFYLNGNIKGNFDMIIVGEILKTIRILVLLILCTITILLSFLYKTKDGSKLLLILPEALLLITVFAHIVANIGDFYYYICYSSFESPSCFPIKFYTVTTSLVVFMAIFFVKLVYIVQSRKKYVSQLERIILERTKELKEEYLKDTSGIPPPPPNIWRLIKESFSPESVWKWKYNSRKHFITRLFISSMFFVPVIIGISFLTFYIFSNR